MSTISSSTTSSLLGSNLMMPNVSVPKSDNPNLARAATNISLDAGVYSSMGGDSTIFQTSDPVGLMNWFTQPYSSGSSLQVGDLAANAEYSVNQQILSSNYSGDSLLNGVYNSFGAVQNQNPNASWAAIIHDRPDLSQTMATDSLNMTIVSRLNTYA